MLSQWWEKQNVRWSKGGGYIAARLWWLAFVLLTGLCLTAPITLRSAGHYKYPNTESLSRLKRIGLALQMYLQDYDERLPPMDTTDRTRRALQEYAGSETLWQIENSITPYTVNPSLSLRPLNIYPSPGDIVAVWDTRLFSKEYRAVCFLDGHAKIVRLSEWKRLRIISGIRSDVSAPPEPSWWDTRTPDDFKFYLACILFFVALTAMFSASFLDARQFSRKGIGSFLVRFALRFFGYGFVVLLTAISTAFVVSLLLPEVSE